MFHRYLSSKFGTSDKAEGGGGSFSNSTIPFVICDCYNFFGDKRIISY